MILFFEIIIILLVAFVLGFFLHSIGDDDGFYINDILGKINKYLKFIISLFGIVISYFALNFYFAVAMPFVFTIPSTIITLFLIIVGSVMITISGMFGLVSIFLALDLFYMIVISWFQREKDDSLNNKDSA
jgi:hypothetical protein